jgi:hypothetical protein
VEWINLAIGRLVRGATSERIRRHLDVRAAAALYDEMHREFERIALANRLPCGTGPGAVKLSELRSGAAACEG